MKEFIVRLFSLLAIVGVLFGYNEVLDVRAKDEEIYRRSGWIWRNGCGRSYRKKWKDRSGRSDLR